MKRKCLAVGIILLFGGISIIPSTAQNTEKPLPTSGGKWLYVGGSGPGNYTKIQDAVDNASNGDTVFVFSGFYQEGEIHITDRKSINIIGEDKNTTIVDGCEKGWVFLVNHTYNSSIDTRIKISSFTIQNARTGIYVYSDNNTINDNIIQNITQGNYPRGIFVAFASNNSIYGNVIRKNDYGIVVWRYHTLNNKIENNFIENNSYGILIKDQVRNTIISHNTIINNVDYGISAEWCFNTVVEKNNIYKNHPNANFIVFFEEGSLSQSKITWNGNYWGKIVLRHKFIFGGLGYYFPSYPYYYHFNWLNFDWFPAKEPYDIPGMS